ncbi:peptidoglycan-binding domain-containing protein [Streptomyces sp. KLOTTS4A1]|uniref:peptidoglycan-binding domain-containing protein n=1 Tax=Streptomyces sp. KLOTTS4A1 TaxID=3390996 RepID=UPI0039F486D3
MTCPHCGTPEDGAGAPRCGCGQRAADASRAERSAGAAEAEGLAGVAQPEGLAGAEGFEPLRIRPYVSLTPGEPVPAQQPAGEDATLGLPLIHHRPAGAEATEPHPADVDLFVPPAEAAAGDHPGGPPDEEQLVHRTPGSGRAARRAERDRRRKTLLTVCGAALAVVAVAGLAIAFSSYGDDERRDEALPDIVSSAPAHSASPTPGESASESALPSESASPTESASPSASPSEKTSTSAPTPGTSGTSGPTTPKTSQPQDDGALRLGDSGSDVRQMQRMLRDLRAYKGQPHGQFDEETRDGVATFQAWAGIEDDPSGVYGPATRAALEGTAGNGGRGQ